jgi:2-polyprenyl-6-methoxyphenol hydroxylase-like FAD-dependent oxidoreductase
VIQTDLWDAVPWRDWSVDRVVLLGDAAHPLTPNLGQGAAQAIEDAWVLARRLVERPLELALREYEQLRAPRTSSLNATAWRFGQLSHWENPLACWLRDLALRWTPASVNTAQVLKVYQPPD